MSACPTPERLLRFLSGALPESEQQAVEQHINGCRFCQALLDPQRRKRFVDQLKRVPLPEEAPAAGQRANDDSSATAPPALAGAPAVPSPAPAGYEVLEEVGRGGMSVVYKARQVKLDQLVALKMILTGSDAGPDELQRFRTEAEAVARLRHPNIVQIHEVGEHEGKPFFCLEYCPGGTLADRLHGTPLPPHEAAELLEVLARAVHAAHGQNVVHRDLKPGNILFRIEAKPSPPSSALNTEDVLSPVISDFGLARKLDEAGQAAGGAATGTPSYMAPEQARGRAKEVGPAADVWALGAVLYECLTGRPPFRGADTADTLRQVLTEEPAPPRRLQPEVPRDLETVCLKCLAKEPGKRYGSALALSDDLRCFLEGRPVEARLTPRWEQVWKWGKRRPALAGSLAVAVLLLAGGLAGGLWYWDAELRTKVGYYTTWTKRWGVPEGVGPLKPADVGRRFQSWKITRRGGKVLTVEAVNGLGYPAWQEVPTLVGKVGPLGLARRTCAIEMRYNPEGRVVGEIGRDAAGRVVWAMHYATPTTVHFADARGYVRPGLGSDAAYVEIMFGADGLEEKHLYRDSRGRRQAAPNGAYGRRFQYDRRGLMVEATYLDAQGNPVCGKDGFATLVSRFDDQGNVIEGTYLGVDGKPALSRDGIARFTARYDERGNRVEEAYFGVDGRPTLHKEGIARGQLRYDEHGNLVEMTYLGADGRPTLNRKGIHTIRSRHDVRGLLVECAFFGTDDKPTLNNDGYARLTKTYDGWGNEVEERCFDVGGRPTLNKDGWARILSGFDLRGNMLEAAVFDDRYRPTLNKNGVFKVKRSFDQRGNLVEEAYFDTRGKPVLAKNGYHRMKTSYDERGNPVEAAAFGTAGQPAVNSDGVHRWKRRYDERDNRVEERNFGPDGKPTSDRYGIHQLRLRYDERGNELERRFFGTDGKPVRGKNGYAGYRREFDARGNVVRCEFFGVDGNPVRILDGFSAWTAIYDSRDRCTQKTFRGFDGGAGFVRKVVVYNTHASVVQTTYLDARGKPVRPRRPGEE
jgi:serine/threonine protein kinase